MRNWRRISGSLATAAICNLACRSGTAGEPSISTAGHTRGALLRAYTREQVDTAARFGGEEFVLLLPDTGLDGAQAVAEKIASRLRNEAFDVAGERFFVTQSVGIAEVVEGDVGWALRVADRNLYRAKQAGRDRIVATVAFAEDASLNLNPHS